MNTVSLEPGALLLCEHENLTKKKQKREEISAAAKAEAGLVAKKRKA